MMLISLSSRHEGRSDVIGYCGSFVVSVAAASVVAVVTNRLGPYLFNFLRSRNFWLGFRDTIFRDPISSNEDLAFVPYFYIPLEDVTHPIFSLTLSLYKLNNAVNDTFLKQQQIRGHLPSPLRHSGLQLYFVAALPKCFHGPTQLGVHSP
ncbi:hypothetical protein BDA99DRAFT_569114 [Phascolomyces articulosus]|uniref:Uncharacterized protein n=1 Tax=Phascolomyces articulosus TaxID=60185 RepID=A0AAD5PJB0_9FUNG|nr:hypothetical protein BDA99DRAFT_569114 [Phascolomyces articulosus]